MTHLRLLTSMRAPFQVFPVTSDCVCIQFGTSPSACPFLEPSGASCRLTGRPGRLSTIWLRRQRDQLLDAVENDLRLVGAGPAWACLHNSPAALAARAWVPASIMSGCCVRAIERERIRLAPGRPSPSRQSLATCSSVGIADALRTKSSVGTAPPVPPQKNVGDLASARRLAVRSHRLSRRAPEVADRSSARPSAGQIASTYPVDRCPGLLCERLQPRNFISRRMVYMAPICAECGHWRIPGRRHYKAAHKRIFIQVLRYAPIYRYVGNADGLPLKHGPTTDACRHWKLLTLPEGTYRVFIHIVAEVPVPENQCDTMRSGDATPG